MVRRSSSRCSAMNTSQWMAPCCSPGRPMPRWSGSMGRRIRRRPHALVRALASPKKARSGPRVISGSSSSATTPTAAPSITMSCCAGNPMPTRHCPATGSVIEPLGATPCADGQRPCPDRRLPRYPGRDALHVAQNSAHPGGSAIDGRTPT